MVNFFFRITRVTPRMVWPFGLVRIALSLVVSSSIRPSNSLGSAFGYKEDFKGLGVFFDVWKNHGGDHPHPWISAMVGDGIVRYNHDSDGHGHTIGGCHQNIANTEHPVQVQVSYHKNVLEVMLRLETDDWKTCFRVADVKLPGRGYIGFTASTGQFAARHDILAVTTAVIEDAATSEMILVR